MTTGPVLSQVLRSLTREEVVVVSGRDEQGNEIVSHVVSEEAWPVLSRSVSSSDHAMS